MGLTHPVTVCCPNETFQIHPKPPAGSNTVEWFVRPALGHASSPPPSLPSLRLSFNGGRAFGARCNPALRAARPSLGPHPPVSVGRAPSPGAARCAGAPSLGCRCLPAASVLLGGLWPYPSLVRRQWPGAGLCRSRPPRHSSAGRSPLLRWLHPHGLGCCAARLSFRTPWCHFLRSLTRSLLLFNSVNLIPVDQDNGGLTPAVTASRPTEAIRLFHIRNRAAMRCSAWFGINMIAQVRWAGPRRRSSAAFRFTPRPTTLGFSSST